MHDSQKRWADLKDKIDFLGYEFLTWLFLSLGRPQSYSEINLMLKANPRQPDVEVDLGSRIVTTLLNHREQKTTVASPLLLDSHEVYASIRNGHAVETLALVIRLSDTVVSFTLNAADFSFTQMKIKNNFEEEAQGQEEEGLTEQDQSREAIFLRMAATSQVETIVDAMFATFVKRRLAESAYTDEIIQMKSHVELRLKERMIVGDPLVC
jgi:hypothetical protein